MSEYIDRALKDLYNKEVDPSREPDPSLFEGFRKTFNHAVNVSIDGSKQTDLAHALKNSNEVFAVFRAHRMGRDMAAQMADKEGNLKSFDRFRKDVEPIADHHVRQWLRTEYDMALSRAHLAADWATYEKDRDIMPNLRWVESTAVTPDAVHSSFWGMVRPVDDAFWAAHHPGDHWGCQCSLEQTDDPVTPLSDEVIRKVPPPSPGLEENPGKTKRIFSDNSPYFPGSCETCPFRHLLKEPRTEKDCYNCKAAKESFQNAYANNKEVVFEYNGHTVERYANVETDKSDYTKILDACKAFAREGRSSVITPKFDGSTVKDPNYQAIYGSLEGTTFEGKCPDFRVGDYWYEHEGFDETKKKSPKNKRTFSNMMNRGLEQSNRLVIEDCGVSDAWMKQRIKERVFFNKQDIKEVWVRGDDGLRLLWKQSEQPSE